MIFNALALAVNFMKITLFNKEILIFYIFFNMIIIIEDYIYLAINIYRFYKEIILI